MKALAIICSILLLASCTPQVYSDLYSYEYEPVPKSSVKVLQIGDSIPEDALAIGKIIVGSKSITSQAQYDKVLELAVGEAARSGGNLLVIGNEPANGNKLQGWATIARGYSSKLIPTTQPSKNTQASEDSHQTAEAGNQQQTPDTVNHAALLLGLEPAGKAPVRKRMKQPVGSIKAGIGPMWTTSRLYIENSQDYETNVRGTGFGASVTTIRWGCAGLGMDFYVNHTTLDNTYRSGGRDKNYSFTQFYIGPDFVCGGRLFGRFRGEVTLGLGLAVHSEKSQQQVGLGLRSSLGLEYMITPKIGIGIETLSQRHLFEKPEGFKLAHDEDYYGYQQLGFLFGLRTYF
jgi:hypothetical protein